MKYYVRLIRPKHWIKNGLIFAALIFSGRAIQLSSFITTLYGFISFCFISSSVYILNDIRDVESDRKHEIKCKRPIASGKVPINHAWFLAVAIFICAFTLNYLAKSSFLSVLLILFYFVLNIFYSFGFKNIPLLDIAILVSGFLIRVLYGATLIQQDISSWLYLTVMSMSFYLGLGKRRNELVKAGSNAGSVRGVLKYYTREFLDKNMYMCLALTLVFYALWSVDPITIQRIGGNYILWTVPLVMLICMKYSLSVESGDYADPVDVLTESKSLIALVFFYGITMICILYGRLFL